MRRSLAIRSLVLGALLVAVFAVPLAVLVRSSARTSAIEQARADARALTPIISLAGDPRVSGAIVAVSEAARPRRVTVVFPDGSVLGQGAVVERDPIADPEALRRARAGTPTEVRAGGGLVVYEPVLRSNGSVAVIRVLIPEVLLTRGVHRAWLLLLLLSLGLVALSVFVADRLGRSLVRSVDRLRDTADRLARGDLHARSALDGPEEIRAVGVALDQLADRIGELIETERAAIADLSHRLRTPVTALRAELSALLDPAAPTLALAVDELTRTIDQIIRDAARPVRAGIGVRSDLASTVRSRAAFWKVLADDQRRALHVEVPDRPLDVAVEPSDLASVVDALFDNVFSHTEEGTAFSVSVRGAGRSATLLVDDDGAGFPPGFGPVRGESGRGSTGLGLDIVRRVAESASGTLTVTNRADGGARVRVVLPLLAGADEGRTDGAERIPG